MQILIVAATEAEIAPFIKRGTDIDVLITGVGVPSALYHLQKRIQQIQYDMVIQAGIAGSFKLALKPGATVIVQQDCFADIGFEQKKNYTPVFETAFADKNEFPFKNGWMVNDSEFFKTCNLPIVKAITVNRISDDKLQKQQYIDGFDADIESMEGAAFHYVCLQENIPFVQIRSVSNFVGERDKTKWKIKESIADLNSELTNLINKLTEKS